MRFLGAILDDFRSIRGPQELPLGGLTVLFGPNSAGKTNVLEALSRAVRGTNWADADDPRDEPWQDRYLNAELVLALDNRDVPDHPDHVLLHQLLLGEWGDGQHERLLEDGDGFGDLVAGASMVDLRALMVEQLLDGLDDDAGDRRLVAEHLVDDARVLRVEALDTWLECWRDHLTPDVQAAAERVASAAPDGDALAERCRDLLEDGIAVVDCVAGGMFESRRTVRAPDGSEATEDWRVVDVVALEYSADGLVAAVTRALTQAWTTLRLFGTSGNTRLTLELLALPDERPRPGAPIGPEWRRWVETRNIDGATWARTNPTVLELANVLSQRATELLPGFVRDQGRVAVTVRPLSAWTRADAVDLALVEPDGTRRLLERCGGGTRRWAAAAIHLACLDLLQAKWTGPALDGAGDDNHEDTYRMLCSAAEGGVLSEAAEPAFPERTSTLLLADEPEANLHPAAVESVVDWLVSTARRTAGVAVATHHPAFLGLSDDDAHLVHVHRSEGRTVVSAVAGDDAEALDRLAAEAGLTRADLLQRTRMVLFVEGPHDQSVLDAYIGDELHAARVLVLPMHGTRNALALVDSELAAFLGIPLGVLTDNATGRGTAEERAIDRLQQEARVAGTKIARFGIGKPDIVYYLDEDACRQAAPAFPGWDVATEAWKQERADGERFKAFVTDRYGLKLDRRTVDRLAQQSAATAPVPKALLRVAKQVTGAAAEAADRRWHVPDLSEPTD